MDSLGKERELNDSDIEEVKEFVWVVMYSGKENESYVATRVRLYHNMKVKSSLSLPPDLHSLKQAILRAHWQTYYWLRCTEAQVEDLSFEGCGWTWVVQESRIKPVWFTCSQMPPSLQRGRPSKKARAKRVSESEDASDESSCRDKGSPPTKRRRWSKPNKPTNCDKLYNADNEDNDTDYHASDVEEDDTNNPNEFESEWEVSDFSSSDDSCDDWIP